MNIKFENLIGKVCDFYGADSNYFKLDDNVFEAVENPADGYRSMLEEIKTIENSQNTLIFFDKPLAKVKIESDETESFSGYRFVDVDNNHWWLTIGTDNIDDYYPYFVFNYEPLENNEKTINN